MKYAAVWTLERACSLLDRLPGQWGCRMGLAHRAAVLDDRWGTGFWGAGEAP